MPVRLCPMLSRLQRWFRRLVEPVELPMAPGERRRSVSGEARSQAGAVAEEAAVRYLRRQGYRILCRDRANRMGEIDIVARRRDRTVFVEVRSRRDSAPVLARNTLTVHKRRVLLHTIELFRRQHGLRNAAIRVDLIAITLDTAGEVTKLEHFEAIEL